MTTMLSRDFQPIAPEDGRQLSAVIELEGEGTESFPEKIVADHLWVFNGEAVWSASLSRDPYDFYAPNASHWHGKDGPKWGPDIQVNVTVRLTLDDQGTFFLGNRDVTIEVLS